MGSAAEFAKAGDISGAIVLVHSKVLDTWDDLFDEYFRAPDIIARSVQGKALLIAFTSSREYDILYRHINTLSGKMDVIPAGAAGARRRTAHRAADRARREGADVRLAAE